MTKAQIALKAFELWMLLPVIGLPLSVWFWHKGSRIFLKSLGVWMVLIPVVLGASYFGFITFSALVVLACIQACRELVQINPESGNRGLDLVIALSISLSLLAMAYHFKSHFPRPYVFAGLLVPLVIFFIPRFQNRPVPIWTLALSLGCSLAIWLVLQSDDNGFNYVLWVFSVVIINDILSFVCGKIFKSPKPFPNLSPNKSIAGYIGGAVSAMCAGMLLRFALPWFTPAQILTAALLMALAGSAGDLFASHVKRINGVKDFGTVLYSMGGALDRMDSLLAAGWAFFLYLRFVVQ